MSRKNKLSIFGQIEKLKDKGITFININEQDAQRFLRYNTYFYKLYAYCENYSKDKNSKCTNLDFSFLVDLSTIDMHLRRLTFRLTADIEHLLKAKLLNDFNKSSNDGYDIVNSFLKSEKGQETKQYITKEKDKAKNKKHNHSASLRILSKGHDMAIWSIVEIISFNQLISFCDYFYEIYPNKLYNESIKDNLHNVRFLRNASAHNNCILLLKSRDAKEQKTTVQFLVQNDIGKHDIQKGFLKNHTINDFITSLIVFDKLCVSDNFKHNYFKNLEYFFTNRMLKNKTYYKNNQLLTDSYKFVLKSVEFFKNKYDANIS